MRDPHQVDGRLRHIPEAVEQLIEDFIFILVGSDGSDFFVHRKLERFVFDVGFRNIGGKRNLHRGFLFAFIDDFALQRAYCVIHHLAVKFIAYIHHMAGLRGP